MSLGHAEGVGSLALDKPQGLRVGKGSSSKEMGVGQVC